MSGQPRCVGDWATAVAATTPESFAAAHPAPFLVQERSAPEAGGGEQQFATVDAGADAISTEGLLGTASLASLLALPIAKRDGSGFTGMVSVGRTDNCDLVLAQGCVSKFHAFFQADAGSGAAQLVDGGSTNGTALNGTRLEAHEPAALSPRDLIAFGADSVWRFHSPASFHELVSLAG